MIFDVPAWLSFFIADFSAAKVSIWLLDIDASNIFKPVGGAAHRGPHAGQADSFSPVLAGHGHDLKK